MASVAPLSHAPGRPVGAAPLPAAVAGGPRVGPAHRELLKQALHTIEQAITTLKQQPTPNAPAPAPVAPAAAASAPAPAPPSAALQAAPATRPARVDSATDTSTDSIVPRRPAYVQPVLRMADVSTDTADDAPPERPRASLAPPAHAQQPPPAAPSANRSYAQPTLNTSMYSAPPSASFEEKEQSLHYSHAYPAWPPRGVTHTFHSQTRHQTRVFLPPEPHSPPRHAPSHALGTSFLSPSSAANHSLAFTSGAAVYPSPSLSASPSAYYPSESANVSLLSTHGSFAHLFAPRSTAPLPPDEPVFSARPVQRPSSAHAPHVDPFLHTRTQPPHHSPVRPSTAYPYPSSTAPRPAVATATAPSLSSFARTLQLQRMKLEQLDDSDDEAALQAHVRALRQPARMTTSAYAPAAVSAPARIVPSASPAARISATTVSPPSASFAAAAAAREAQRRRDEEEEREEQLQHERTLARLRQALAQPIQRPQPQPRTSPVASPLPSPVPRASPVARPLSSPPPPAPASDYSRMRSQQRATEQRLESLLVRSSDDSSSAPRIESDPVADADAALNRSRAHLAEFDSRVRALLDNAHDRSRMSPSRDRSGDLDRKILSTQERAARVLRDVDETLGNSRRREEAQQHAARREREQERDHHERSFDRTQLAPGASTWNRVQEELRREEEQARERRQRRDDTELAAVRTTQPQASAHAYPHTSPYSQRASPFASPASSPASLVPALQPARELMANYLHAGAAIVAQHERKSLADIIAPVGSSSAPSYSTTVTPPRPTAPMYPTEPAFMSPFRATVPVSVAASTPTATHAYETPTYTTPRTSFAPTPSDQSPARVPAESPPTSAVPPARLEPVIQPTVFQAPTANVLPRDHKVEVTPPPTVVTTQIITETTVVSQVTHAVDDETSDSSRHEPDQEYQDDYEYDHQLEEEPERAQTEEEEDSFERLEHDVHPAEPLSPPVSSAALAEPALTVSVLDATVLASPPVVVAPSRTAPLEVEFEDDISEDIGEDIDFETDVDAHPEEASSERPSPRDLPIERARTPSPPSISPPMTHLAPLAAVPPQSLPLVTASGSPPQPPPHSSEWAEESVPEDVYEDEPEVALEAPRTAEYIPTVPTIDPDDEFDYVEEESLSPYVIPTPPSQQQQQEIPVVVAAAVSPIPTATHEDEVSFDEESVASVPASPKHDEACYQSVDSQRELEQAESLPASPVQSKPIGAATSLPPLSSSVYAERPTPAAASTRHDEDEDEFAWEEEPAPVHQSPEVVFEAAEKAVPAPDTHRSATPEAKAESSPAFDQPLVRSRSPSPVVDLDESIEEDVSIAVEEDIQLEPESHSTEGGAYGQIEPETKAETRPHSSAPHAAPIPADSSIPADHSSDSIDQSPGPDDEFPDESLAHSVEAVTMPATSAPHDDDQEFPSDDVDAVAAPPSHHDESAADVAGANESDSAAAVADGANAAAAEYASEGYYDEDGNWIPGMSTASAAQQPYYDPASGQYYDPVSQCYWNDQTETWEYAGDQTQDAAWDQQAANYAGAAADANAEPYPSDGAYAQTHDAAAYDSEYPPEAAPVLAADAATDLPAVSAPTADVDAASPPHSEIEDELDLSADVSAELVMEEQPPSVDVSFDAPPQAESPPPEEDAPSPRAQAESARQAESQSAWAAEMAQMAAEQEAAERAAAAEKLRLLQEEEERREQQRERKRRDAEAAEARENERRTAEAAARAEEEQRQAAAQAVAEAEANAEAEAEAERLAQAEADAQAASAAAAEEARDAAIESEKARQLALDAAADEELSEDIEYDEEYPVDVDPIATDSMPTRSHQHHDESSEFPPDESSAAQMDIAASSPPDPTSASRRKADLVDAITLALLQDLTRDSLAATTKSMRRASREEAERDRRDAHDGAKTSATEDAAPAPTHDEAEISEEEGLLIDSESDVDVDVDADASLDASPAASPMGTSEFHINLAGVVHREGESEAPSAAASFDGGELAHHIAASVGADAPTGALTSASPLLLTGATLSPPLSGWSPPSESPTGSLPVSRGGTPISLTPRSLSAHSSPTLSPRGSLTAPPRDDRALDRSRQMEMMGRARLGDVIAERGLIGGASARVLVEEQNALATAARSRGGSASSSPVVSPRLAQRLQMQRRGDVEDDSVSKLNLNGLLAAVSPRHSPRVISPRTVRTTGTSAGAGVSAAVGGPTAISAVSSAAATRAFDVDALVDSLTDTLLTDTQRDLQAIFEARRTSAKANSHATSTADAPLTLSGIAAAEDGDDEYAIEDEFAPTESPRDAADGPTSPAAEEYEISHEDLASPSHAYPHARNAHAVSGSARPIDSSELDNSASVDYTDEDEWPTDEAPTQPPPPPPPPPAETTAKAKSAGGLLGALPPLTKGGVGAAPASPMSTPPPPPPPRADADEYADDDFDEFAALESVPPPPPPPPPAIVSTPAFVRKYLVEVMRVYEEDVAGEHHKEDDGDATEELRASVEAGGGHFIRRLPESVFVAAERDRVYLHERPDDAADLPRSFGPPGVFPIESQQIFHKLLFDSLNECVALYQQYWTQQRREPWYAHKRLLGTVLETATRAANADEQPDDDDGLPPIATHMKQVSLEHGYALVAHSRVPTRHEETLAQLQSRLVAKVVASVAHMHHVTDVTPTLATALHTAAAHVAALTAGPSNGQPPTANVKIPSQAQSVLEYEMGIAQQALDRSKVHHAKDTVVPRPSSPTSPSSLLDLSCDSLLEWSQLEARESITLVEEIADRLLQDMLGSTVAVLKTIHNRRASINFQESMHMSQQVHGRRSPIKF